MSQAFGLKALSLAVLATLATSAQAAGLDRSGQDVTAFLQDGTYAEAVYTYIDADVKGHDNVATTKGSYTQGKATGDIAETYDFFRYGVKADINDRFSVGVIYDEPFGAAVEYQDPSNFNGRATVLEAGALNQIKQSAVATAEQKLANFDAQFNGLVAQTGFASSDNKEVQKYILQLISTSGKSGVNQLVENLKGVPADSAALTEFVKKSEAGLEASRESGVKRLNALELFGGTNDSTPYTKVVNALSAESKKSLNTLGGKVQAAAVLAQDKGNTNVEIRTRNTAVLLGAKFGENRNFQIYGGPAVQHLKGEVHLRGNAYQSAAGYDARITPDTSVGWVAGVAYSKPEIALKAALTYRSEIEHNSSITESFPALALREKPAYTHRDFKVKLPESYNLDFQTGVNPTTLLTAKVRYVPWSKFDIRPPTYGDATALVNNGQPLPIVSYKKDQWSAEVGLGKRLTDKIAVSGSVGYDSGAGNPTTTLGPIKGYYSVGLGAKYNLTPQWSISAGGKYLMFGDATANLPTGATAGKFADNDGFIAGVKLAYQAK